LSAPTYHNSGKLRQDPDGAPFTSLPPDPPPAGMMNIDDDDVDALADMELVDNNNSALESGPV
jgi:hypothetical protein